MRYTQSSVLGRARKGGKIKFNFYNPREFTKDKHMRADRRPYGGGPGMVLSAEPIIRAVEKARGRKKRVKVILTSHRGRTFTSAKAKVLSRKYKDIVIICGHYEGIDARVRKILRADEISIGDYVLTGGELPAIVIADTVSRYVPGVLGREESLEEKHTASRDVYTRPEIFKWKGKSYRVPKVLISGNHQRIEGWREKH